VNEVLLTPEQWLQARSEVVNTGLEAHRDGPKNWDHYLALESILAHVDSDELIVDGGGDPDAFCCWLTYFGYRNIMVINPGLSKNATSDRIQLKIGDITNTVLDSGSVGCLTCMSVIEHGVDVSRFFKEAYRIIRPGGRLIISTDYWPDSIDTSDRYDPVYKCPVKIFSAADVRGMVHDASEMGFRPSSIPTYEAAQRVVTWERMRLNYTFILLEFVRDGREAHSSARDRSPS
jgi:SAM-dependent methyltransferase